MASEVASKIRTFSWLVCKNAKGKKSKFNTEVEPS
jgi:hypothetical protein